MNLETIKKDRIDSGGFLGYEKELITQLEEKDREIKRLQVRLGIDGWYKIREAVRQQYCHRKWALHMLYSTRDYATAWKECAEKAEVEIKRLRLDGWIDLSTALEYQRRHRKWALQQCRTWARHFCFYKDAAVRFHSDRADKAEAELAKIKKGGVKSY